MQMAFWANQTLYPALRNFCVMSPSSPGPNATYSMVEAGLGIGINNQVNSSLWQDRVVHLPLKPAQTMNIGLAYGTVSYTHLDVYKRQALIFFCCICAAACLCTGILIIHCTSCIIQRFVIQIPVSYTHLCCSSSAFHTGTAPDLPEGPKAIQLPFFTPFSLKNRIFLYYQHSDNTDFFLFFTCVLPLVYTCSLYGIFYQSSIWIVGRLCKVQVNYL